MPQENHQELTISYYDEIIFNDNENGSDFILPERNQRSPTTSLNFSKNNRFSFEDDSSEDESIEENEGNLRKNTIIIQNMMNSNTFASFESNATSNLTTDTFVTANANNNLFDMTPTLNNNNIDNYSANPKRHVFATFAKNNNDSKMTIPQESTLNGSYQTTPNISDFSDSNTFLNNGSSVRLSEKNNLYNPSGLGLSTGNLTPTDMFPSKNIIIQSQFKQPSSPVKAIRASMILQCNGIHPTNKSPVKSSAKQRRSQLEEYNLPSTDTFIFENTVNTVDFDSQKDKKDVNDTIGENQNKKHYNISNDTFTNKSDKNNNNIPNKSTVKTTMDHLPHYAYLFISAIQSFDAATLEHKEDVQICLSFNKDDIAFVHNVDESGWGEVTLIKDQKKGWVPLNYFTDVITVNDNSQAGSKEEPLKDLLSSSAQFITDAMNQENNNNKKDINIETINNIRDGVKKLLELTRCVSRSDELVQKSEPIKKTRKKLLADWYNLMIKADYYKSNISSQNLPTIITLIYALLERSFTFFKTWEDQKLKIENDTKANEENKIDKIGPIRQELHPITNARVTFLTKPPNANIRLNEVYDILFSYASIIMGRIDMIEHNPSACEALEYIVHQMIVLLRELLYISKSCSYIIKERYKYAYENTLDNNLDPLLSLVSELVSCTKVLVTQALYENVNNSSRHSRATHIISSNAYRYTPDGKHLTEIVASMTSLIHNIVFGCSNYLRLIGDFPLGNDRKYPDFASSILTSHEFVKKCKKNNNMDSSITKDMDGLSIGHSTKNNNNNNKSKYSKMLRYSTMINGGSANNNPEILESEFLKEFLPEDEKAFSRDSTFEKYKLKEDEEALENKLHSINDKDIIQKELSFDSDGNLIGSSFRALIFKLTDELDKPNDLLISSFLLYFRKFGTIVDLVNELISRFDVTDKYSNYEYDQKNGNYSSRSSRLKSRRRLVCNVFKTWMQSFWMVEDYRILPTILNFYNEGVSIYLPIQSKYLIETAARLFLEDTKLQNTNDTSASKKFFLVQLNPKEIIASKTSSIISDASSANSIRSSVFSLDDRVIEEYGLTNIPQNNQMNSETLPLPALNLGTSSLLSSDELVVIRNIINYYQATIGPTMSVNNSDNFTILDYWNTLQNLEVPADRFKQSFIKPSLSLSDMNPFEMAKQLTIIESTLFLEVRPFELVNYKKPQLCPNINRILKFTNQLSNYVLETLVIPGLSMKQRAARLKCWLRIALSCIYFRNYNSVASIMTTLQNHIISKLAPVWELINKKDTTLFEYLARIVHPNHNFKVYRNKLKLILGDHQYSKSPLPVVPFFNLFLQDLTFLDDGNADYKDLSSFRPNRLINVDKYVRMTSIISDAQFFQVAYEHTENGSGASDAFKTESFFHLTEQLSINTNAITQIPMVEQYILLEFHRVEEYYKEDNDRGYQLSLAVLPKI